MTAAESIYQCQDCLRQHDGHGTLLRFKLCVPTGCPCGLMDCELVMKRNSESSMAQEARRREDRRSRMANGIKRGPRKPPSSIIHSRPVTARCPHPSDQDFREGQSLKSNVQSPGATGATVAAKDFSQRDFEASGAAASADARLWEFFFSPLGTPRPERFNVWFNGADLEDVCQTSRRMNNRARTLRDKVLKLGFYLDNQMSTGDGACSQYRLCCIEDATSLSEEQRVQKLVAAGLRPAAQGNLLTTDERG